ncbi:hypothetical protein [Moorena sp. SIO3A5]|uniref:hypothetical protein n=1 Tax=Moorena sp. SIO3A5 TaxID=2607822 RepID=UPI00257D877C|nr:hypothetical protein [Moorena sp. SIO3A5]
MGRSGVRGYLKSFLILNFAPLAPQFWGEQESFAGKSPPKLGDLGGLYVANETSQTTSQIPRNAIGRRPRYAIAS